MDINKSIRFVTEDKQWMSKLLIAVLMTITSFLIVPALILQGYAVKIIRQVMNGDWDGLPEWENYGDLLRDGFFVTVAEIVYTLPFILLFIIGGIATGGIGSMSSGDDLAALIAGGGGLMLACLGVLFAIALLFLTPAILIQYAIKDDFGATLRFGEVFAIIRNHTADILIVFLISAVVGMALSMLIGVLTATVILIPVAFLLIIAVGPYVTFVTSHLYGQIATKVLGNKAGGSLTGMA